ncbi:hypothetical protein DYB32_003284 [Aphanomyces invadans]|uniref:Uncharacterized protein n=1 Tax=Aphanomyces invadans TaxID=157072 RepID=A0A418B0Y5_9STRA|nr:hypothetical protein DYB32_003284 [Aphanomyces invadans]
MAREDSGAADPTNFSTLDTAICMSYLVSVLVVGGIAIYVSRKKTTLDEYYLGGRTLPWWMLGIADVSSYIDIAGTMINTGLIYALGVRGMFIEVRGGLCLFLAFQLAFTGKLARRCPVRTKGEWIKFRFGAKVGGRLARTAVAIVSLIGGIFSVAYFSIGGGKFVTEFVAVPAYAGLPPDFWASGILMAIALMYTIVAGFTSMVLTDIYQSLFIYASFVAVSIWGMQVTLPAEFHVFLPTFNTSSFLNVTTTHDAWTAAALSSPNVPAESPFAMYNSFRGIVFLYLTLQCLRSASGPGGLQTVLATKSELDVRKQSMLAMLLLLFRWAFGAAIAVLAIHYTIAHPNVTLDAEKVVPFVLANVLPSGNAVVARMTLDDSTLLGYRGFVVASLLAAALTTFDSTIHSASSYWTIDIYHAILHPRATAAQLVFQARLSTVVIVLLGWLLSLGIVTINRIWGFMTIAMCGGVVYPFFLSWYWARFNGAGCAAGLVTGIVAAATIFLYVFVSCTCFRTDELAAISAENWKDLGCSGMLLVVQIATYVLAVSVVLKVWHQAAVLAVVLGAVLPVIYFKWYLPVDGLAQAISYEPLLLDQDKDAWG